MASFYVDTLRKLTARGLLDPDAPTLVVAGGRSDHAALLEAGFTNVTISNLDVRMTGSEYRPFSWKFLDGENLDVPDNAYSQVIEHMGLHHCGSPHRALLEMYRAASNSVLAFENRDSLLMKLGNMSGLVDRYELVAVQGNDYNFGGHRNTAVPNFVYRWNEREVEKTIASFDPAYSVPIEYFHNLRMPSGRFGGGLFGRAVEKVVSAGIRAATAIAPRQCNEFGFFIDKSRKARLPWINEATGKMEPPEI